MSNAPSNSSGEHGLCGSNVIWNNQMSQQRPIQTHQLAPLQPMIDKTCAIYPQFLVFWFLDSITSKIGREIDMTLGLIKRSILTKVMLNPRTPEFGEAELSWSLGVLLCQQCQILYRPLHHVSFLVGKNNGDWLSWQTHVVRRYFYISLYDSYDHM